MGEQPSHTPRQSYVYAIGEAAQNLVKIGVSTDPIRRRTFIQTTCPFPVDILWMQEGDVTREAALHGHFAARRIRGEWFEFPDGDAVARLKEATSVPAPPPTPTVMGAFDFSPSRRAVGAHVTTVRRLSSTGMSPDQVLSYDYAVPGGEDE